LFDAFYRKGGLDAIVTICRSFIRTIFEHSQTKAEDRTEIANQALGHAYGGIKVALHLLHSLTSSKPIFESSQTILLLTRDKKDTDPDYFEPHNFMVKTRLAVLPIVRELWEAPWLVSSPQSLIKSVVQVVLEILNGEGEESPPEISPHTVPGASSLAMGGPSLFRVTVPDENRIRQLTDMGFSRPGAERALIRTHNNVNAATELLLSNPFRFQNDPEPVAPQPQEPGGSGEATSETPPTAAEEPQPPSDSTPERDDVATPSLGEPEAVDADTRPPGKSADEWRSELNTMREPLKSEVGRLALRLVDEYPELIFDVHNAFVGRDDGYQRSSVRLLIDDIPSFAANSQNGREQHLAVRCRLLALVLNEAPASFAATVMGDEQAFMEVVLTLLLSFSIDVGAKQATIPKWLAALMLVAEALLSLSEDPRSVTVPKEGEPIVTQEILTGPPYVKARTVLFDFSLRLLALPGLPRDELLASLRLLVFMTRDHDLAMQFVKHEGVSLLFKSLKTSSGGVAGSQSYISVILRHIVEDPVVLRHIMREEVQRFLSHPRTRTVDATGYVRACNALALRDPKAFIDVTKSLAQLERPFAYISQIVPKDKDNQEGSSTSVAESSKHHTGSPAEITAHAPQSPPEYFEAVVHFLVGELVEFVRSNSRQSEGVSNPESTSPDASAEGSLGQPEKQPAGEAQDSKPDHYYTGFLMQSLTELMFSYDACKTAFLSYSPSKRSGISSKDAAKGRQGALNFVLSDLVSFRTIDPDPNNDARNKVPLCNWAMSLIVALCVDTSSSQPIKDVSPELVTVRKTVLEAVSRAIKDPCQSESLDARYGRLLALADLCYRLLTVRFNPGLRKPHEETPTHIAKIMLEKNFVSTLTNALAEVDLNYPNVRVVVAAMLKPLELL
jgi:E3 ubiquitin-protein ligase HUWE1